MSDKKTNTMESPFTHNTIADGNNFLARKKEVNQIASNILEGRHTVIYEPPKTGKDSAVRMALNHIRTAGSPSVATYIDMLSMTESDEFAEALRNVPDSSGGRQVIYIRNFQNLLKFDDWEKTVSALSREMQKDNSPAYIITGSGINAMKYIFGERKLFYRQYDHVRLYPIDEKSVTDHIIKTFLRVGRVVEQNQAEYIYNIADGHPWYIWQIANSCFNLTKGYLSNSLIQEAVDSLLFTHSVRFQETVDNLSRYQIYFLRAVFDGISKASSMEVIEHYRLNSSANVHRVKEAMAKKEVISVNSQDIPYIIDPIFRLWLEKHYFKTTSGI